MQKVKLYIYIYTFQFVHYLHIYRFWLVLSNYKFVLDFTLFIERKYI